jgi:hypothetical protein
MGTQDEDGWEYRYVDYSSPLATRVGMLTAAIHDLEEIGQILDRLIQPAEDLDPLTRVAYWTFAVTRYGRLFTGGRRHNAIAGALKRVLDEAPPGARVVHNDVLAVRHKHAAHVDGDLDDEGALIQIRIRNGNELQQRVTGYSGGAVSPTGPILTNFRTLVAKLINEVNCDYKKAHARLGNEVNAIPVEQLAVAPASTKLEVSSVDWNSLNLLGRERD